MPPPLPPENQYGHTKKLQFLIGELMHHKARAGRPLTVLDFGCGNGCAVSQFLIRDGIRYYGVDIHPSSLAYASEHFGKSGAMFLDHVPAGVTFDVIVYADVLEHINDPVATMRAHRAQLAADGIVIGAVPNGFGPFENEQRVDRWFGLSKLLVGMSRFVQLLRGKPMPEVEAALPYNQESGHVIFFTRGCLVRAIGEAGFELVRFCHGAFMGASVSGVLLCRSARLLQWNVTIADRLPYWAVSTWYFSLRRREGGFWSAS